MAADRNLGFDVNAPGTSIFIVQVVFLALAWITALLRAFVKAVLLRRALIDDYVMLFALLGYTATGYFVFSAVLEGGLGRPATELSPASLEVSLRSWFGNMVLAGPVSGLARVSIASFLLRIAVRKWHRLVLHGIVAITGIMTIVYFFLVVFQCSPPAYFWERMREGALGSCVHSRRTQNATLVWGSFAAAMDWMLGLLPISILWNVRINRQSKVGIAAILSFGIIAGIALIIRLIYITMNEASFRYRAYGTLAVSISAIVELALGIIAGCIATLAPLFKKMGLQFGGGSAKRGGALTDTMPWQRSATMPEPRGGQAAESIIMMSPRRLEGERDAEGAGAGTRWPPPRAGSPAARRVLSSSNWDIDIEAASSDDDSATPRPSGREIQVRTFIRVSSQPSGDHPVVVGAVDPGDKPLPPPPLKPRTRDGSIPRSRPLTPNLF
ncbi:hypothetical protein F4802DRAFT_115243 [Xylaria palmicola]|nr:hypothetical protein F4802DRAFT_115243 [Xylaria palmicola]